MAAELILKVRVDRTELNALQAEIAGKEKAIRVTAKGNGVKETGEDVKKLGENAKKAESEVQSLGDMLAKKIAWYAISQSVVGVVNAFKEALNTIKEVDKQLATIKKVTDFSDAQMQKIKDSAYEVASAYGVAAQAYLDSVGTFAKAGYKEAATQLGELATKTQLVGDVNSSIANQFLLSVDAAWKYKGSMEDLSRVLDEANEVENNYATSIEKIAIGMPNVASIASMVGMSVEETIAALGTITAVTQQTGPKASTALRALILNITGKINEAFEDESGELVEWTEEEIGVMQRFLQKYAGDVVKTAQLTGELVNPIEAIRALGQALENGEVSARDMYTELSALGGKLRTNQLVALVENYQMMDEMLVKMGEDAKGSATKEINVMLDTWDAKTNILKNTFAEFVEQNLNTDSIKNFIDEVIELVKTLETLPNPLLLAAAGIAALVAPTILKSLKQVVGAFQDIGNAIRGVSVEDFGSSLATAIQSVATLALTVGLYIYNQYQKHLRQAIADAQEEADKAIEKASNEHQKSEEILELYDAYLVAKNRLDGTTEATNNYITAVEALANATGITTGKISSESEAVDELSKKFQEYSKQQLETELQAQETAKELAIASAVTTAKNTKNSNSIFRAADDELVYDIHNKTQPSWKAKSIDEAYRDMRAEYERIRALRDAAWKTYLEDKTEENLDIYEGYAAQIDEAEEVMSKAFEATKAVVAINGRIKAIDSGFSGITNTEETTEKTEEATEAVSALAQAYDAVFESAKNAADAIERYNDLISGGEATDNADKAAEIYEDFLEQLNKGNYGSSKYQAGIDLFLSDEKIAEYKGNYAELGQAVKDVIDKYFVTGYDEDENPIFATGEEAGQRFAEVLRDEVLPSFDETKENAIMVGDELAATFRKTDEGYELIVEDYNLLSQALNGMDVDVIKMLEDAMEIKISNPEQALNLMLGMAEAAGAIATSWQGLDRINIAAIINQMLQDGKTPEEVKALADEFARLDEEGKIDLYIDRDQLLEATDEATVLLQYLNDLGIPITTVITVDDYQARQKLDDLKAEIELMKNNTIHINVDYSGAKIATQATGTKSAQGGATLVNEEGAEIIQENGTARIAGGGKPTITYLQPGARVWNARETQAILGNSKLSELFDGIRSMAGGGSVPASVSGVSSYTNVYGQGVKIGSTDKDSGLEWIEQVVDLRKQELSLIEARNESVDAQVAKQRQIQEMLAYEIEYLKKIGGSQTDIDKLATEWYEINSKIKDLREKEKEDRKKEREEEKKKEEERKEREKKKQENTIKWYEKKANIAKAELDLLEAEDAPVKKQVEKHREISNWYRKEINYLKKIGGHQEDVLKLEKQRKDVEEQIAQLNQAMMDDLAKAINEKINKINEKRDKELEAVQKDIDALKEQREAQDKVNESEEKHQALVEAWRNLKNVKNERNVRQYNAKTGQWEWVADANAVASAKEGWNSAKQAWSDYKSQNAYEKSISKLEAKQEEISKTYEKQVNQWQKVLDALEDPVITIAEALKNIEQNATKDQKSEIKTLNKLLKPLGYSISTKGLYDSGGILSGVGGIKGTRDDEMVLPPDVTKKLLKPMQPANFTARMNELRYLYGAGGGYAGLTNNSIGSQHNGDLYTFGSITLTESVAKQTTLYDFVQASKGLRAYNGTM